MKKNKQINRVALCLCIVFGLTMMSGCANNNNSAASQSSLTKEAASTASTGEAAASTSTEEAASTASTEDATETASTEEASAEETAGSEENGETEYEEDFEYEEVFSYWEEDVPALDELINYVEAVTTEGSPDFIPEEDRIATFDMDGTLVAELNPTYLADYLLECRIFRDPSYTPDEEMLEFGKILLDGVMTKTFPEGFDIDMEYSIHEAKAYEGMTMTEFADFVTEQLLRDADGFEGMTYGESFYKPMIQVVEYLQDNGFTCYVCSGNDRFICRVMVEGMLDIPYENIIGMDVELEAADHKGEDGLEYDYSVGEEVVRTDRIVTGNVKANKVNQIAQEIGRSPVLSFGNSSGDVSMHNYCLSNKDYKSAAFMLVADDDVRDYGDPEKTADLRKRWEESGYHVVSMANDWKTIYGENVVKTGSFSLMENMNRE